MIRASAPLLSGCRVSARIRRHDRYRFRRTASWLALVEAHNALPTDHPTRRAVAALLTHCSQIGVPAEVWRSIVAPSVQALLLGPPTSSRRWA